MKYSQAQNNLDIIPAEMKDFAQQSLNECRESGEKGRRRSAAHILRPVTPPLSGMTIFSAVNTNRMTK